MTEQIFSPKMLGYWTDEERQDIPDESGIFCVFRAGVDSESGEMDVQELLYVGESRNVRHRLLHHEEHERWRESLESGEALWYSMGPVSHLYRERIEAAIIHEHKPRLNKAYIDDFPFDETTVHLTGKRRKLLTQFTVQRKE